MTARWRMLSRATAERTSGRTSGGATDSLSAARSSRERRRLLERWNRAASLKTDRKVIGPRIDDLQPSFRVHTSEYGFRDHIRRIAWTDQTGGEASQFVRVLPVDLAVSCLHTHTIPQPSPPGDTEVEFRVVQPFLS